MAGTIIADYIRTDANKLSLNVGNTTFATINAMGLLSNTGTTIISANGSINGSVITANTIPNSAIATGAISVDKITDGTITAAKMNGAQAGSAPAYVARASVMFDASSTLSIRSAKNVTSVTDNSTNFYVNFTTPMADALYSVAVATSYRLNSGYVQGAQCPYGVYSTTQVGIQPYSANDPYADAQFISVTVF